MENDGSLSIISTIKTVSMLLVVGIHESSMWTTSGWFTEPACESWIIGEISSWMGIAAVPLFFFCSGYLYAFQKKNSDSYQETKSVISKKFRRLIVPYVFASVVWVIPVRILLNGFNGLITDFLFAVSPAQLWFLPALFFVFIIAEAIWSQLMELARGGRAFTLLAIALLLFLSSYAINGVIGGFLQLASAFRYFPFFLLGGLSQAWSIDWSDGKTSFASWTVVVVLMSLWSYISSLRGLGSIGLIVYLLLWLAVRVCACIAVVSLFFFARESRLVKSLGSSSLAQCSLGIYLFHQQVVQLIILVLNKPFIPPICIALLSFIGALFISWKITKLLRTLSLPRLLMGG